MAAFSFSSCSRAATPAADRARTRWTSMIATRVPAPLCAELAGAPVHMPTTTPAPSTTAALTSFMPLIASCPPRLECGAHGEVEVTELLTLLLIQLDAVVDPDRAERRVPPESEARAVAQVGRIEPGSVRLVGPPHIAHIVEQRRANSEEQRDQVLDVPDDLDVAADPRPAAVPGRHLQRLELAQRVGAAKVESLEEGHRLVGPAEHVPAQDAPADDMVEPERMVVRRRCDSPDKLFADAHAGEVEPDPLGASLGGLERAVPRVAPEGRADKRNDVVALRVLELLARRRRYVGDVIVADPVERADARVVADRMPEANVATERVDAVVGEYAAVVEQVEACRQRAIEEPGLGEADLPLLDLFAAAKPEEHFPALAEEVALGQVDGAQRAVLGAEAAADGEEPRRLLSDVDVDDDLVLRRAGRGGRVDLVEVVQVREPLFRALHLRRREQLPFGHGDLTAQDLLFAPRVAADVDPLDEHFGTLGDLEGDVDLEIGQILSDVGVDVRRRAPDGPVHVGDALHGLAELRAREHVAGREKDPPFDFFERQHAVAGDVDPADVELRALDDDDLDGRPGVDPVDLDVGGLNPRLDVAVVVVELDDSLDVLVELLPLDGAAQDEEFPLLRQHDLLDLLGLEALRALDHDLFDGDLAPFGDAKGHGDVAVRQLLGVGRDSDLEIALFLVILLELLGRARDGDRVVDAAQLEVDLLLQGRGVELLVPGEEDVADERPLHHDEGQLDAALEVLDLQLHVVEEAQREDRPDVLGLAGGREGLSDLRADSAQNDGLLDPTIALNGEFLDEDLPLRRRRGLGETRAGTHQEEGKKNGEKSSPLRAHEGRWLVRLRLVFRQGQFRLGDLDLPEDEVIPFGVEFDPGAVRELAAHNGFGERVLHLLLDGAPQLPGAVGRVVALLDEQLERDLG